MEKNRLNFLKNTILSSLLILSSIAPTSITVNAEESSAANETDVQSDKNKNNVEEGAKESAESSTEQTSEAAPVSTATVDTTAEPEDASSAEQTVSPAVNTEESTTPVVTEGTEEKQTSTAEPSESPAASASAEATASSKESTSTESADAEEETDNFVLPDMKTEEEAVELVPVDKKVALYEGLPDEEIAIVKKIEEEYGMDYAEIYVNDVVNAPTIGDDSVKLSEDEEKEVIEAQKSEDASQIATASGFGKKVKLNAAVKRNVASLSEEASNIDTNSDEKVAVIADENKTDIFKAKDSSEYIAAVAALNDDESLRLTVNTTKDITGILSGVSGVYYDGSYILIFPSESDKLAAKETIDSYLNEATTNDTTIKLMETTSHDTNEDTSSKENMPVEDAMSQEVIDNATIVRRASEELAKDANHKFVALIDSGVNDGYADFSVNVTNYPDADAIGHGTEMAKIIKDIAGDKATILSIKAFGDDGDGSLSNIYAAVKYAINQKVDIINISASMLDSEETSQLRELLQSAMDSGITIVVAAGNYGENAEKYFPANMKDADVAGAVVYDVNTSQLTSVSVADFSNYGPTVDYYYPVESTSAAAANETASLIIGLPDYYHSGNIPTRYPDAACDKMPNKRASGGDSFADKIRKVMKLAWEMDGRHTGEPGYGDGYTIIATDQTCTSNDHTLDGTAHVNFSGKEYDCVFPGYGYTTGDCETGRWLIQKWYKRENYQPASMNYYNPTISPSSVNNYIPGKDYTFNVTTNGFTLAGNGYTLIGDGAKYAKLNGNTITVNIPDNCTLPETVTITLYSDKHQDPKDGYDIQYRYMAMLTNGAMSGSGKRIQDFWTPGYEDGPHEDKVDGYDYGDVTITLHLLHAGFGVSKIDAERDTNIAQGDATLAGTQFTATKIVNGQKCPTPAATLTTGANGTVSSTATALQYGHYEVVESKAPTGYKADSAYKWTFETTSAGQIYTAPNNTKAKEMVFRGGIDVYKHDAYRLNTNDTNYLHDPEGDASLQGTEYTISNESTPADGSYDGKVWVKDIHTVIKTENGDYTINTKKPANDVNPVTKEKGAWYDVGEDILTLTTNEKGYASTGDMVLPYGTYNIKETAAPKGYLQKGKMNETVEVHPTDDVGPNIVHVYDELYNDIKQGGIKVTKNDLERHEDNQSNPNEPQGDSTFEHAVFNIYLKSTRDIYLDENPNNVYTDGKWIRNGYLPALGNYCDAGYGNYNNTDAYKDWKNGIFVKSIEVTKHTDANGNVKYYAETGPRDLNYGSYYMIEAKAPEGYYLDTTWRLDFQIREDGKMIDATGDYISTVTTDDEKSGVTAIHSCNKNSVTTDDSQYPTQEQIYRGDISVTKCDFDRVIVSGSDSEDKCNVPQGDAHLDGAKFEIINRSKTTIQGGDGKWYAPGKVVVVLVTDKNGFASTRDLEKTGFSLAEQAGTPNAGKVPGYLPYGTYEVKEVTSPEGYKLNKDWSVTIEVRVDGKIYAANNKDDIVQAKSVDQTHATTETSGSIKNNGTYSMTNDIITGGIKIQKDDLERHEDSFGKDGATNVDKQANGTENADTANIPQGDATMAGAEFTIYLNSPNDVYANKNNPDRDGGRGYGWAKKDSKGYPAVKDGYNEWVKTVDKGGKAVAVQTITTDASGIAQTGAHDLPYGSYYIVETKAPDGYYIDTTWRLDFQIREEGVILDTTKDYAAGANYANVPDANGEDYSVLPEDMEHYIQKAKAAHDSINDTIIPASDGKDSLSGVTGIVSDNKNGVTSDDNQNRAHEQVIRGDIAVTKYDIDRSATDYANGKTSAKSSSGYTHEDPANDQTLTAKGNRAQGDASLAGAEFTIYNISKQDVQVNGVWYEPTTKEKAIAAGVEAGRTLDKTPMDLNKSAVVVLKTDENGFASTRDLEKTGWPEAESTKPNGATFEDAEKQLHKTADGKLPGYLPYGTYLIMETKAPEGYWLNNSWYNIIEIRKDETTKGVRNQLSNNMEEGKIYTAEFAYNSASKSNGEAKTNANNGGRIDISTFVTGKDSLDKSHYQGTGFNINGPDYIEGLTGIHNGMTDDVIRGGVKVKKVDIERYDASVDGEDNLVMPVGTAIDPNDTPQGDATLEGAQIAIINDSDDEVYVAGKWYQKGDIVYVMTTDASGEAETPVDLLPYGTYNLIEIAAPVGYLPDETWSVSFQIRTPGVYDCNAHKQQNTNNGDARLTTNTAEVIQGQDDVGTLELVQPVEDVHEVVTVVKEDGTVYTYDKTETGLIEYKGTRNTETDGPQLKNQIIRGGVRVYKYDLELDKSETTEGFEHTDNTYGDDHINATGTGSNKVATLNGIEFTIVNVSNQDVKVDEKWYEPGEVVKQIYTYYDEELGAYVAETDDDELPYGTYTIQETQTNNAYLLTDGTARLFEIGRYNELRADAEYHGDHDVYIRVDPVQTTVAYRTSNLVNNTRTTYSLLYKNPWTIGHEYHEIVESEMTGKSNLTNDATTPNDDSKKLIKSDYDLGAITELVNQKHTENVPDKMNATASKNIAKSKNIIQTAEQLCAAYNNDNGASGNERKECLAGADKNYYVHNVAYGSGELIRMVTPGKPDDASTDEVYIGNGTRPVEQFNGSTKMIFKNQIKRGEIAFEKKDAYTNAPLESLWILENVKTKERHVIYADENGRFNSTKFNKSKNTNANDWLLDEYDALKMRCGDDESAYITIDRTMYDKTGGINTQYGTWFYQGEDGDYADVNNNLGSLPYGYYRLIEIPTNFTNHKQMITPPFSIDNDKSVTQMYYSGVEGTYATIYDEDGLPTVSTIQGRKEYRLSVADEKNATPYAWHNTLTDYDIPTESEATIMDENGNETKTFEEVDKDITIYDKVVVSNLTQMPNADSHKYTVVASLFYADVNPVKAETETEDDDSAIYVEDTNGTFYKQADGTFTETVPTDPEADMTKYRKIEASNTVCAAHEPKDDISKSAAELYSSLIPVTDETGKPIESEPIEVDANLGRIELEQQITLNPKKLHLGGHRVVVFETVYDSNGTVVSKEADITNINQTITFIGIHTTAADTTDNATKIDDSEVQITDAVKYVGLKPGKTYRLEGTLHYQNKDAEGNITDGGEVLDENSKPIKGVVMVNGKPSKDNTFKAKTADGTVNVVFTFKRSLLKTSTTVAFEKLYEKDREVATHEDITDVPQTTLIPNMHTTATAEDDKAKTIVVGGASDWVPVTVHDTVTYTGLKPDTKYELVGVVHLSKDGGKTDAGVMEAELTENGDIVPVTNMTGLDSRGLIFTPKESDGTQLVTFTFNGVDLEIGDSLVVYEYLYKLNSAGKRIEVKSTRAVPSIGKNTGMPSGTKHYSGLTHDDITDKDQTVELEFPPVMHTNATGILGVGKADADARGTKTIEIKEIESACVPVTIFDTITYARLNPNHYYSFVGVIHYNNANEGEEGIDGDVFETNIVEDGKCSTEKEQIVSVSEVFKPTDYNGISNMKFTFNGADIFNGQRFTVFEYLYDYGTEKPTEAIKTVPSDKDEMQPILTHEDINDNEQTVKFTTPNEYLLRTTATGNKGKFISPEGKVSITDTVSYILKPNTQYKLVAELHHKVNDKDKGIVETKEQLITTTNSETKRTAGETTVTFDAFDFSDYEDGTQFVVFEYAYELDKDGKVVDADTTDDKPETPSAEHAQIKDTDQTVEIKRIPEIHTTAVGNNGEHTFAPSSNVTIIDKVVYKNLKPNTSYKVTGTLHINSNGTDAGELTVNGKPVTAEQVFKTGKSRDGSVEVTFTFNASGFDMNNKLVAFEKAYELDASGKIIDADTTDDTPETPVATHEDIKDEGQTVTPKKPEIHTTAAGEKGEKDFVDAAKVKIVDTVEYKGLTPGKTYRMDGEMHVVENGKAGAVLATQTASFIPTTPDGSVKLTFDVDAGNLVGKSAVAFETCYELDLLGKVVDYNTTDDKPETPVAEHKDVNDKGQTVTFSHHETPKPTPGPGQTPSPTPAPTPQPPVVPHRTGNTQTYVLTGIVSIAAIVLIVVLLMKKKRDRSDKEEVSKK